MESALLIQVPIAGPVNRSKEAGWGGPARRDAKKGPEPAAGPVSTKEQMSRCEEEKPLGEVKKLETSGSACYLHT